MPDCVSNTSPLIALSSVRRLDLVRAEFPQVFVPQAVFDETVTNGSGWIEADQLQKKFAAKSWLTCVQVAPSPVLHSLKEHLAGSGEAEAIVLARQLRVPVLLDELAGRRAASSLGVTAIGSLYILRRAKKTGRINQIRPFVDAMVRGRNLFSRRSFGTFFTEVGEP